MNHPNVPVMLYDGDCGFCQKWIKKWDKITIGKVVYLPYQEHLGSYPQITKKACQEAVQLIMPDKTVYSGAHAALKALSLAGKYKILLWKYEHIPLFGPFCEFVYRQIARHRTNLSGKKCGLDQ
ncbi:MAG: hypothetical protein A3F16_03600 [Deltaproteobacteria bacterium RIFCSPHIGHO2_12_FULL_43_9]|nr:MAG: hypothetical protein A3F16_03600 [Deltaproteobacteria bacterium RIFCSPHIGHO2_12_FULL_43_9]